MEPRIVGDEELAEHKPLVLWQIRRMGLRASEDVVGAGMLGLWMALRRYRPARGQLSTYAVRCIRGQLLSHMRRRRRGITAKDAATASLSTPVRRDRHRDVELGDLVAAPEPAEVPPADIWLRVARWCIEARGARMLTRYYRDGLTLEQVGLEHGLTRQRVQQIIARELAGLRRRTRPADFE